MAKAKKHPVTAAIRVLRAAKVAFEPHEYAYEDKGGTARSASELGVDEHQVVKTLLFEDDAGKPFVILMHGDRQVSGKELARAVGAKAVKPCEPKVADRHSGYQVGGTSPFGLRKPLPIYWERTIADLPRIYINGGKRGFLVSLEPAELARVLSPTAVCVAIAG